MSDALPNGERGRSTRILSLCLPRLRTDRLIRPRLAGRGGALAAGFRRAS